MRRTAIWPTMAVALGAVSWLAAPLSAGALDVNATAAAEGANGLEVTPGSSCVASTHVTVDEASIVGDRTACSTITVKQGAVGSSSTFAAGDVIVFEDFSVSAGGVFTAGTDASLSPFAWVGTDSPSSETSYIARFMINLDPATIVGSDRFSVLEGFDSAGASWFKVLLRRNAAPAENRLLLEAREDNGTLVATSFGAEIMVPAGWHEVEVRFGAGVGTGTLLVALDAVPFGGLTGLANATGRIDLVRFGAVGGEPAGTTGSYYLDSYESFRTLSP